MSVNTEDGHRAKATEDRGRRVFTHVKGFGRVGEQRSLLRRRNPCNLDLHRIRKRSSTSWRPPLRMRAISSRRCAPHTPRPQPASSYAANVERNPEDHDALYNWALVLQESADNAGPDVGSPGKDALLEEACKKYKAATELCPTLHEAYYNWAIAISDRAKIRGRTKEAEDLWKQACDKYDRAVQLNWNSPQALNNWGLALQELGPIVALKEKRAIVKKAIRKFRAAIRLRFDFHRAVYNLGTVLLV